jgi:hypothetical protein
VLKVGNVLGWVLVTSRSAPLGFVVNAQFVPLFAAHTLYMFYMFHMVPY